MALAPELSQTRFDLLSDNRMHLIVMPTEQCNFRCSYCYEDFEIGAMSDAVWSGVAALVERRVPELRSFELSWFGGEPLLAAERVVGLTQRARDLAVTHGVQFGSDITTNASLLRPRLFERLTFAGVGLYQITLDGPAAVHDRFRTTVSRRATFDEIRANLLHALATDHSFSFVIRIHVREELRDHLAEMADLLAELDDPRVSFFFRGISDLGGPHSGDIPTMDPARCDELCAVLQELAGTAAPRTSGFDPSEDAVCYASLPSSWVIRADGTLGKCTVALTDSRNSVGRITADGQLDINSPDVRPWIRGVFSNKPDELGCPLQGLPVARDERIMLPMPTFRAE